MCLVCNTAIENEFHFLFECCQYNSIREIYIPKYYFTYPSYDKFKELLTKKKTILLLHVCKFVSAALKQREIFLSGAT